MTVGKEHRRAKTRVNKRRRPGNKIELITDSEIENSNREPEFRTQTRQEPEPGIEPDIETEPDIEPDIEPEKDETKLALVGGGKGWTAKDERMYGHIYESYRRKGFGDKHAKKLASATVNKFRSRKGAGLGLDLIKGALKSDFAHDVLQHGLINAGLKKGFELYHALSGSKKGGAVNPRALEAFDDIDALSSAEERSANALANVVGEGQQVFDWQQTLPHLQPRQFPKLTGNFGYGQIPDANARAMREWARSNIEQKIIQNAGPISHRERALMRRDAIRQLQLVHSPAGYRSPHPPVNPRFATPYETNRQNNRKGPHNPEFPWSAKTNKLNTPRLEKAVVRQLRREEKDRYERGRLERIMRDLENPDLRAYEGVNQLFQPLPDVLEQRLQDEALERRYEQLQDDVKAQEDRAEVEEFFAQPDQPLRPLRDRQAEQQQLEGEQEDRDLEARLQQLGGPGRVIGDEERAQLEADIRALAQIEPQEDQDPFEGVDEANRVHQELNQIKAEIDRLNALQEAAEFTASNAPVGSPDQKQAQAEAKKARRDLRYLQSQAELGEAQLNLHRSQRRGRAARLPAILRSLQDTPVRERLEFKDLQGQGFQKQGGVINPYALEAFLNHDRLQNAKLNSARLLAMLPNTHGVAAQQEELGMRHRPMAIARPDITHAQSGFDNIPTGVQAVRSQAPTYNDRLAAKQHMLDMLRRRELGTSMTSPQSALKKGYLNLARTTSQAQRSISRRNALDQLRGRLRGGDFAGGTQQLFTSSINETSPEDGVWFDPHPATGPMACAPYPKTNGGWGADGGNHNPLWQFSAANRSSKSLVNEPYRVAYWTPHGLAVNCQHAYEMKSMPKASNFSLLPFRHDLRLGGDLIGSLRAYYNKHKHKLPWIGAATAGLGALTGLAHNHLKDRNDVVIVPPYKSMPMPSTGGSARSPSTMHFGNQTQRWDGGTADYWQRGVLHAGVSRSTANTPYSYTPFPHREGGNWSSLHIGYADTGVPGTGLKPALTPFRSPLTPASATWVSSLSTQTGNPAHANISVIGGARDRSGYAKSRIGLMPVRNQLM